VSNLNIMFSLSIS